jgi:hypothetical protein
VVELGLLGAETRFDIAQALAISELSKDQTKELIPAGEVFDIAVALVSVDANLKLITRKVVQELSENGSAKIHLLPPAKAGKQ